MKRTVLLILAVFMLLSGCTEEAKPFKKAKTPDSKISGVWVTYSEIDGFLKNGKYKKNIDSLAQNLKKYKITDVFFQVHPFCDSLFKSKYFPQNELAKSYDFDCFKYLIKRLHGEGIRVHAWLNPYRVRTADSDISKLDKDSPAYKWLTDGSPLNDSNVSLCGGIYLNPASIEVKKLILDGIREIIENYDVDGIHIDDYFYPTTDGDFDAASYSEYKKCTENPLDLSEYRISHINSLISSVYTAIKFHNKDTVFSISPSASISKNKEMYYADIEAFTENECVDILIPQAYFGFEYPDENFRFPKITEDYKSLDLKSAKLVIGLATYKIGTPLPPDNEEWENGKEIIGKQIRLCESDDKISGYCFFSYTSFIEYMQ